MLTLFALPAVVRCGSRCGGHSPEK